MAPFLCFEAVSSDEARATSSALGSGALGYERLISS
jgi:hypothetical protein